MEMFHISINLHSLIDKDWIRLWIKNIIIKKAEILQKKMCRNVFALTVFLVAGTIYIENNIVSVNSKISYTTCYKRAT